MYPLRRIPSGASTDPNLFLGPSSSGPKVAPKNQNPPLPKSSSPRELAPLPHVYHRDKVAASLLNDKITQNGVGASPPPAVPPSPSNASSTVPKRRYEKELPPPMNNTDWILENRSDLDKNDRARAKRVRIRTQQVTKGHYKFE